MDYQFPSQLFPGFYNRGPPDSVLQHCAGSWGSYGRVLPVVSPGGPRCRALLVPGWLVRIRNMASPSLWFPDACSALCRLCYTQGGSGDLSSWTFTSRHRVKGEAWSPTEPAPVPLLSPKPGESASTYPGGRSHQMDLN